MTGNPLPGQARTPISRCYSSNSEAVRRCQRQTVSSNPHVLPPNDRTEFMLRSRSQEDRRARAASHSREEDMSLRMRSGRDWKQGVSLSPANHGAIAPVPLQNLVWFLTPSATHTVKPHVIVVQNQGTVSRLGVWYVLEHRSVYLRANICYIETT